MAKTIQIPSSKDFGHQTDHVRTGCCLFIDFKKSGYFQSPLAIDFFEFKESRVHVNKGRSGPFKTPKRSTTISWEFESDDGTVRLDGTINVDPSYLCDELILSHRCTDDDRVEEPGRTASK